IRFCIVTTGAAIVFLLPVGPLESKNRVPQADDPGTGLCAPSMWNARAVSRVDRQKQAPAAHSG
ncbi:MAG: hypothetical protein KKA44_12395, partial [Alphaproteobacteria bacterium]|nr:hypothetical protein [Alphaproteobacteria bacterium]